MTREEAIEILKEIEYPVNGDNRERRDTAFDMAIKALENERPKGKWIIDDLEFGRVWKCHCSICGKDPLNYVYGTENWWLYKADMPKCCPSCGAEIKEAEE